MKAEETTEIIDRRAAKRFNQITLFILLFTVFSGAVRKWGVESGLVGNAILGIQLVTPLMYLFLGNQQGFSFPKWWPYFLLALVFGIINPLQKTVFTGLFGSLLYLSFPVIIIKYFANRSRVNFNYLTWFLVAIVGIEFSLGLTQYYLPGTHYLNKYALDIKEVGIAYVGSNVRVTGTFSYLGGYGAFVTMVSLVVWSMLVGRKKLWVVIPIGLAGLGCALFSGSRGAFIVFALFAGIGLFNYITNVKNFIRFAIYTAIFAYLLAYLDIGGFTKVFDLGTTNLEARFQTEQKDIEDTDLGWRTMNPILQPFIFTMPYSELIGIGIGSTYQGAIALFGLSEAAANVGFWEDEVQRVMIEGGYLLLLFRALIVLYFVRNTRIPGKPLIFAFIFFFGSLVFNIYGNIFLALGLIMVDQAYYRRKLEKEVEVEAEPVVVKPKKKAWVQVRPAPAA